MSTPVVECKQFCLLVYISLYFFLYKMCFGGQFFIARRLLALNILGILLKMTHCTLKK